MPPTTRHAVAHSAISLIVELTAEFTGPPRDVYLKRTWERAVTAELLLNTAFEVTDLTRPPLTLLLTTLALDRNIQVVSSTATGPYIANTYLTRLANFPIYQVTVSTEGTGGVLGFLSATYRQAAELHMLLQVMCWEHAMLTHSRRHFLL
jgi:hypothetical protein